MKTAFLYILFFFSTGTLLAQGEALKGRVVDDQEGKGVSFATVRWISGRGVTANVDGYFSVEKNTSKMGLVVEAMGYDTDTSFIDPSFSGEILVKLSYSSTALNEVVVVGVKRENPAHPLFRKVVANRDFYNKEKLSAYQYEVYNKMQFDLNNFSEKFQNRKVMKPFDVAFEAQDTLKGKNNLPLMIMENLSDYYYLQKPRKEKEIIKASRISGVENESVSQFMGQMHQEVSLYGNYLKIFGKNFISPISKSGLTHYKYYLLDSAFVEGYWCYQLRFFPKHKQSLTFAGDLWVNDSTFAVKRISGEIPARANINFVNGLWFEQDYAPVYSQTDTAWFVSREKILVDFSLTNKTWGVFGRKSSSYKNVKINRAQKEGFYQEVSQVKVLDDARTKNEEDWQSLRHDTLSAQEENLYVTVDSIQKIPRFRLYNTMMSLLFTGYYVAGPLEIGQYFTFYTRNPVEGNRFNVGGRTSNKFSTRLMLEGFAGYGTLDKKYKYGFGYLYFLNKSKKPRQFIEMHHKNDVQLLGLDLASFSSTDAFYTLFQRSTPFYLGYRDNFMALEREWMEGFSSRVEFRNREFKSLGWNFEYQSPDGSLLPRNSYVQTELAFSTRFAYREKYLSGEFERISLGTRYPVLELRLAGGMKGVLDGAYSYQKAEFSLNHWFNFKNLGKVEYVFRAGKTWGTLPFLFLKIHQGNEAFYMRDQGFNMMNYFEFVSDQYLSLFVEHHWGGFFFNKVPLFRRLRFREVWGAKALLGGLDPKHQSELAFLPAMYEASSPYVEVFAGVENIFKMIRFDGVWRLSHLDHPNVKDFGLRVRLHFDF